MADLRDFGLNERADSTGGSQQGKDRDLRIKNQAKPPPAPPAPEVKPQETNEPPKEEATIPIQPSIETIRSNEELYQAQLMVFILLLLIWFVILII